MRPIIEASQGKRHHGLPASGEVGARSVRWLGVGAHHSSLPKARDEILSFCSAVFGKGKSDGLDDQDLYDALRVEAVIIELQDRVPQCSGGAVGLLACFLVGHVSSFLAAAWART
jgi:hypothetical protein